MTNRFLEAARGVLIAALSLSPVVFALWTADVVNLAKITVLWIGGVIAAGLVAAALLRERKRVVSGPLWIPLGIYIGAVALATVTSTSRLTSIIGLQTRFGGLIPRALYVLIALLIVTAWRPRVDKLHQLAVWLAVAGGISALYVLLQAGGYDWIKWTGADGKRPGYPIGTMGNSNFAGAILAMLAPFTVALALRAKDVISKFGWWTLAVLQVAALWFTQTRGGAIGLLLAGAVMLIVLRDRAPRWIRFALPVGAAAVIVFAVTAITVSKPGKPAAGIQTLSTDTFHERGEYWGAALKILADRPILGTGPDTYYFHYPRYRSVAAAEQQRLRITDKPHNVFLEIAVEMGLVGVGAFLALLVMAFWRVFRRPSANDPVLLAAFGGSLAAYVGQGFFSIDVPPLAVMCFAAIAGIALLTDPKVQPPAPERRRLAPKKGKLPPRSAIAASPTPRVAVEAGVAIATLALLYIGTRPFRADAHLHKAQLAQAAAADTEVVRAEFAKARSLHAREPVYWALSGAFEQQRVANETDPLTKQEGQRIAIRLHEGAEDRQPGNVYYALNLARAWAQLAQAGADGDAWEIADRWFARAQRLDPRDPELRQIRSDVRTLANAETRAAASTSAVDN